MFFNIGHGLLDKENSATYCWHKFENGYTGGDADGGDLLWQWM